jgi:hypothetical protein
VPLDGVTRAAGPRDQGLLNRPLRPTSPTFDGTTDSGYDLADAGRTNRNRCPDGHTARLAGRYR